MIRLQIVTIGNNEYVILVKQGQTWKQALKEQFGVVVK